MKRREEIMAIALPGVRAMAESRGLVAMQADDCIVVYAPVLRVTPEQLAAVKNDGARGGALDYLRAQLDAVAKHHNVTPHEE